MSLASQGFVNMVVEYQLMFDEAVATPKRSSFKDWWQKKIAPYFRKKEEPLFSNGWLSVVEEYEEGKLSLV